MDWPTVWISLKTASASIAITFFLGIAAAWRVARMRGGAVRSLVDGLFTLPLVLPPTVAGFFLLYLFGLRRPLGQFLLQVLGVRIVFSWQATVLAAVFLSFPLMYRSARGAFEQVDASLLHAARTIGMPEARIFWRVVLPLALPGVVSGGILAFARGLGEFGATAMLAGNIAGKTRTLPLAVYSAVAGGDTQTAFEYAGILAGISFLAVAGVNCLGEAERRRRGGKGTR